VVGRDDAVARPLEAVAAGGAHVIGDRRMGKTWLIKKLQDRLADTVTATHVSGEVSDLDQFAAAPLTALRGPRRSDGVPTVISGSSGLRHVLADLNSVNDLWHINHYKNRLREYYGPKGAQLARVVLDILAVSDRPIRFDELGDKVAARNPDLWVTRDDLLELLDKLRRDHYTTREGNADRMSSLILARIWRHLQRLS